VLNEKAGYKKGGAWDRKMNDRKLNYGDDMNMLKI